MPEACISAPCAKDFVRINVLLSDKHDKTNLVDCSLKLYHEYSMMTFDPKKWRVGPCQEGGLTQQCSALHNILVLKTVNQAAKCF